MENLERWEGIFQSGKSQGILSRLEKSGNFAQNTGKTGKFEFSLSNMGEIAVKSHASGKKHQTAVTQSQKASSVSEFFEAKSRTTSGLVSSENLEEPSASLIHDHEVTLQESGSMSTSLGNVMSKFTLTRHQHKAEILWALKTVMSHFSYNS